MTNSDSILKSRSITLPTNFHLVNAMVFPVVMYRCESCTIKSAERWRIDAFESDRTEWLNWTELIFPFVNVFLLTVLHPKILKQYSVVLYILSSFKFLLHYSRIQKNNETYLHRFIFKVAGEYCLTWMSLYSCLFFLGNMNIYMFRSLKLHEH